jgi:hypothetical protein
MAYYTPEYILSLKNHDLKFNDFDVVIKKISAIHTNVPNKTTKRTNINGKYPSRERNHRNHNRQDDSGWRTVAKERYKTRFNSDNNNDLMKIKINENLNKLSNSNLEAVKESLGSLLSINNNNYDAFAVDMLFMNSTKQPLFCKHYVNLLDVIKDKSCVKIKYDEYFEFIKTSNKDEIHKKGYTSFIVEMYNSCIINNNEMSGIVCEMCDDINSNNKSLEKYLEHLLIIFKNSNNKELFGDKKEIYINMISSLSKNKSIPSMHRFKLMNIASELK